jgi:hypothetical protein
MHVPLPRNNIIFVEKPAEFQTTSTLSSVERLTPVLEFKTIYGGLGTV